MFGLGTIINVACVVVGGILGMLVGKLISESLRDTLTKAMGVSVLFIGIAGALEKMFTVGEGGILVSDGTMMLIISIAIGTVIGELCHVEDYIEKFGAWLKEKTGNAKDKNFIDGFVTASLTTCIGAMAVVGSMEDGMFGDYSILAAKAVLDLIIVMIMTSSMGKGCAFAAIPIAIFQGVITIIAHFAGTFVSDATLHNISLVGSVLIFCVGVNLVWGKLIKVANILPALIVASLMTLL